MADWIVRCSPPNGLGANPSAFQSAHENVRFLKMSTEHAARRLDIVDILSCCIFRYLQISTTVILWDKANTTPAFPKKLSSIFDH